MKRLNRLLVFAIAGTLVTTASCGEDGGSPVELDPVDTLTFDVLTGCSATCIPGFVTLVDSFQSLVRGVARGRDTIGSGFDEPPFDLETGAFGFYVNMNGDSKAEVQVQGMITPIVDSLPDKSCNNGMLDHVNKVCLAEWDLAHVETDEDMGHGTFSIVFLGFSSGTPSFRVTIARENTLIETEDGCALEITGLQLMLHPFTEPQLVSATVSFRMTSENRPDSKVLGDLIYGYDPSATSQSMSMTGQYTIEGTTQSFTCSMDLDTYEADCSLS